MSTCPLKMKGLFFFLLFLVLANAAYAQVPTPTFPLCANPQGVIRVQYGEGTHGIVGDPTSRTGSDTVYTLSGETLTQCFCSIDGDGIQTNWWKVSSLETDEVNILLTQGWHYIPNGALWGLEETPYLAINSPYGCKPQADVQSVSSNSNSSNNSTDTNNSSAGQVLGTTTSSGQVLGTTTDQVLGLATTGNQMTIVLFVLVGLISLISGSILFRLR